MSFLASLTRRWTESRSLVCVGLDPDPKKLPSVVKGSLFEFNRAIIDATAEFACCFKPQIAYYAAAGAEAELEKTIRHVKERHPGIPVILDAKRGDIGSTAEMYAAEAFDRYGADAVTVNPYMGGDTLEPYLKRADKGVVILCRTSNSGARDLQDLDVGGKKLYRHVAEKAAREWNANRNVMLVVGATYPEELREIRGAVGELPFLVPGIGAQGGDVEAAVRAGKTAGGAGLAVNSSRGIIHASSGSDFAEAAAREARKLRDQINLHR